jgi:hypothetical protein
MTRAYTENSGERKDLVILQEFGSYMLLACGAIYVISVRYSITIKLHICPIILLVMVDIIFLYRSLNYAFCREYSALVSSSVLVSIKKLQESRPLSIWK